MAKMLLQELVTYKFDYSRQDYFNEKGRLLENASNHATFPCSKCRIVSIMMNCDAYNEYYKCINCKRGFKVN